MVTIMDKESHFHDTVNLIYEAVLDEKLWPKALTSLADVMETTHIGLCAMDRRAQSYDSIVPRTDPEWDARYKQFWAFHNPLWTLSTKWPANEIFFPDDLMPREDFVAMPIYNEWFRPAGFGLALMGSNLPVSDEASALIVAANGPGQEITAEQAKIFKAALRHINRAVGIHREFRICDLDHDIAPERLEHVGFVVFLVDVSAKVLFANAWARPLLIPGSGLTVRGGHLFSTDRASILHRLIGSCAGRLRTPNGPGGEIALRRCARRPLRVTVTPLRPRGNVAELPWLGLQLPVAMITISDLAMKKWLN